jgi:hypothetical protein
VEEVLRARGSDTNDASASFAMAFLARYQYRIATLRCCSAAR